MVFSSAKLGLTASIFALSIFLMLPSASAIVVTIGNETTFEALGPQLVENFDFDEVRTDNATLPSGWMFCSNSLYPTCNGVEDVVPNATLIPDGLNVTGQQALLENGTFQFESGKTYRLKLNISNPSGNELKIALTDDDLDENQIFSCSMTGTSFVCEENVIDFTGSGTNETIDGFTTFEIDGTALSDRATRFHLTRPNEADYRVYSYVSFQQVIPVPTATVNDSTVQDNQPDENLGFGGLRVRLQDGPMIVATTYLKFDFSSLNVGTVNNATVYLTQNGGPFGSAPNFTVHYISDQGQIDSWKEYNITFNSQQCGTYGVNSSCTFVELKVPTDSMADQDVWSFDVTQIADLYKSSSKSFILRFNVTDSVPTASVDWYSKENAPSNDKMPYLYLDYEEAVPVPSQSSAIASVIVTVFGIALLVGVVLVRIRSGLDSKKIVELVVLIIVGMAIVAVLQSLV